MSETKTDKSLELVATSIRTILSHDEGTREHMPTLESLSNALLNDIVQLARNRLSNVLALVTQLKMTALDTAKESARHDELEIELESIVRAITTMKASLNNEVSIDREVIDSYLEQFSRFTYLLIDIDQLWKDTTARCQDFLDLFKALTKS